MNERKLGVRGHGEVAMGPVDDCDRYRTVTLRLVVRVTLERAIVPLHPDHFVLDYCYFMAHKTTTCTLFVDVTNNITLVRFVRMTF